MRKLILLSSLLVLCSCPFTKDQEQPLEYTHNPDAQDAFNRLTNGGTTLPTGSDLAQEVSNPGPQGSNNCTEIVTSTKSYTPSKGNYNLKSNSERVALVNQIKREGVNGRGYTKMVLDGKTYKVLNDSPTLSDGTYVPMTFPEAKAIASAWGCKIPNANELKIIANYARSNGNQFPAIPRTPNNGLSTQLKSMNELMNDPRMHQRSTTGRSKLIDGHFKWYDDRGRIYGFAKGNGSFYQNSPSGAHVGDPDYYDYSHGVRLICPE